MYKKESLIKGFVEDLNEILKEEDYRLVSSSEDASWQDLAKKYEFIFKVLDVIVKNPINQDPYKDAEEIRSLAEGAMAQLSIGNHYSASEDLKKSLYLLRVACIRQKVWIIKASQLLEHVSSLENIDSDVVSSIKSLLNRNSV